jgi:PAS domain S-box-containing protein
MHRRLPSGATDTHAVTLRHVPLLMHLAWQEHAAELLRDYLLATVEEDPSVLEQHAHASEALGLLADQIPAPELPDDPDALLSQVTEEQVTADVVTVAVPATLAPRVSTLDALLTAATARAHAGEMLSPPTQPEIAEMRAWLCGQISGQIDGTVNPEPWCARADVQRAAAPGGPSQSYRHLTGADRPLLVADEDGVIVAASPAALTLLGYGRAEELVGRRVIAVVPARYHQAHIAGTTLHAITGRDHLLGVPLIVSMVRADGTEIPVALEVRPQRLDGGHCLFVARFDAA